MNKPIIPQIYGYVVCIIAIILIGLNANTLVNATFDRLSPAQSDQCSYYGTYSSWSKGNTYPGSIAVTEDDYREQKNDCESGVKHRANRDLVSSGALILLGIGLFVWHWRWLNKESK